jgi:glutamine synthetase adenylyltransferase
LRAADHELRLILGRSTRLPLTEHPAFRDIARRMDYENVLDLKQELEKRMKDIRDSYDRIVNNGTGTK